MREGWAAADDRFAHRTLLGREGTAPASETGRVGAGPGGSPASPDPRGEPGLQSKA